MSTLAERQLAAWQRIAMCWGVHYDRRSMCCDECGKGVWLATDIHGNLYHYTEDDRIAHIVLHLRNHHPDLDPDR